MLLDLYEATEGTVDQRRADARRESDRSQDVLTACMKDRGQPYFRPADVDIYAGWDRMILPDPYPELAEVSASGFGFADRLLRAAQASPAARDTSPGTLADLSPEQQRAYNEALDVCVDDPALTTPSRPKEVMAVTDALLAQEDAVIVTDEVQRASADYGPCLERFGFAKGTTREDLIREATMRYLPFDQVAATVEERAGGATPPSGPEWDEAVAYESRAASADASCRTQAHAVAMALLGPRLERFAAEHTTELAAARRYWAGL